MNSQLNTNLIDEIDEIVYVSDIETHELLFINLPGRRVVNTAGYTGQKCYRILQGRDTPCPFCTNHLLNDRAFYTWEFSNPHLGRHFIVKDKLIPWNGKLCRMEYAVDITERENISKSLSEKLEISNALVQCVSAMIASKDLGAAVETVLESIGRFYSADRAYIIEMERQTFIGSNIYEWRRPGVEPRKDQLKNLDLGEHPLWIKALEKNRPIQIDDIASLKSCYPEEYEMFAAQNVRSLLAVPFSIQNDLAGYIVVDNPAARGGNVSLLDSITYFISNEFAKRRMNSRLEYLSYIDPLSGLQNRNRYVERLEELRRKDLCSLGAGVADINGLKRLNQTYNQSRGDSMIALTGRILRDRFGFDNVFRLNGDEFIILSEDIPQDRFLKEIRSATAELEKEAYGVSIGSVWSNSDPNPHDLINHAEELMFVEKQRYYQNAESNSKHHRPEETRALLDMIRGGCFRVALQPKNDIRTGALAGAEALVRFQHPEFGAVSPDKIIPLLERKKTIRYVDFHVCKTVCETIAGWRGRGLSLVPISFNLSRITLLESDLAHVLESIQKTYDIPKNLLEIEITEDIGKMEGETIARIGGNLQKLGFDLALDDFGAKYSSLSILTLLRFNVLKLDRSLINGLSSSPQSRVIVRHIIEMCREMGIQSVAEGVEAAEQLDLLRAFGCDIAQGFYFDRPLYPQEFEQKYLRHGALSPDR